jgi:hypothetical protein
MDARGLSRTQAGVALGSALVSRPVRDVGRRWNRRHARNATLPAGARVGLSRVRVALGADQGDAPVYATGMQKQHGAAVFLRRVPAGEPRHIIGGMDENERNAYLDAPLGVFPRWYRLEGHEVVPCRTMREAVTALEGPRHVSDVLLRHGRVRVSTVFLGLDHGHGYPGHEQTPVVFETMVFTGTRSLAQERYCTWAEAEAGHAKWAHKARNMTLRPIPYRGKRVLRKLRK